MNVNDFISAVIAQDEAKIRPFFADSAVINWHCTNESFTVDEFIKANCEYPGNWRGEVERVAHFGFLTVAAIRVYPEDRSASYHCVSFIRCKNGKIVTLDEYWCDDGQPPEWRRKMNIGRPISKGKKA